MTTFSTREFAVMTERNGGASINHLGDNPKNGYMVGRSDLVDSVVLPAKDLATNSRFQHEVKHLMAIVKALNTMHSETVFYLGSWIHESEVYLDVSQEFTDIADAMQVAQELGELAIWDVQNANEITVSAK